MLGPGFLPSTGPFLTRLAQLGARARAVRRALRRARTGAATASAACSARSPPEHYAPFDAALETLFAARTNLEVLREAVARKLLVAPTLTLAELDGLAHFRERESFVELEHAEPGLRVRYPGPFARFGASPLRYALPPPRLDEHGAEHPRRASPSARPRAAAGARAGCRSRA